ncbi:MAG: hypothetical protein ACLR1R_00100 [Ruminococcus callidus]
MKYTIAFPAGLTAAVLLLCTGCAATQVRDRAYLQAIELRSPDTPTVLLHDFHESKAIAYGKGSSVSQAVANAAVPVGKTLFLGHLELIAYENPAFGEQLDDLMQQSPPVPRLQGGMFRRRHHPCTGGHHQNRRTAAAGGTRRTVAGNRPVHHSAGMGHGFRHGTGSPDDRGRIFRRHCNQNEPLPLPFLQMRFPDSAGSRGDNYPEQFSTESGSYTVSSAKTQLSAEKLPDGFHVTAAIFLEGEGDFEAASQEIARLCQAAFRETVSEYHADVFDVEPCLWSQCYKDMEQSDWKTAAGQMHFSVQVNPHKNML